MMMRLLLKFTIWTVLAYLLLCSAAGIYLAEGTIHMRRKAVTAADLRAAGKMAAEEKASIDEVTVRANDGATLAGWYFSPVKQTGKVVVVLHGQGDNRAGTLSYDRLFLRHHFSVLAIDSRGHGNSGGEITTYGVIEGADVRCWLDWLATRNHPRCIYGLGESMGAAILLQSLRTEQRFCAVAAESSFSSFREIAFYRVGHQLGQGAWLGRFPLRPVVEAGLLYGRFRYGVDLSQASPEDGASDTRTPILLIHGTEDDSIPLNQSEKILGKGRGGILLWKVPGAKHTGALSTASSEFERRVLNFFSSAGIPES